MIVQQLMLCAMVALAKQSVHLLLKLVKIFVALLSLVPHSSFPLFSLLANIKHLLKMPFI